MKSCNYTCPYCPFSKRKVSKEQMKKDKKYMEKFMNFLKNSHKKFNVFLAPKGEILTFDYYKEIIAQISHFNNIGEIVVQTNLSSDLQWLKDVNRDKLILWTTYHPEQVEHTDFLKQVNRLVDNHIKFTVGVVGIKENFKEIKEMKVSLNQLGKNKPYFWINAYKDIKNYYTNQDIQFLKEIDKLFEINLKDYPSIDANCKAGNHTFFVEWNGMVHRCWQDKKVLGNIYRDDLDDISMESRCRKKVCSCFIGYSHMENLNLDKIYKNSLLGRTP